MSFIFQTLGPNPSIEAINKLILKRRIQRRVQLLSLPDSIEKQQFIKSTVDHVLKDMKQTKHHDPMALSMMFNLDKYMDHPFTKQKKQQSQREKCVPDKHSEYNPLINKLGLEETVKILQKQIINTTRLFPQINKIVSVGSGAGDLEARLQQLFLGKNKMEVVCIDPDALRFHSHDSGKQIALRPDYSNIDEYIQDQKKKGNDFSNCLLLLNWPDNRPAYGAGYDEEAIKKVKPVAVLILYSFVSIFGGTSGSREFHQFREKDHKYSKEIIKVFPSCKVQPASEEDDNDAESIVLESQTFVIEYWERRNLQQQWTAQQLRQKALRQYQQLLLQNGMMSIMSNRTTRPGLFF